MKTNLTKSVILFAALSIAGICLVVFGQAAADAAVSATLPLLGEALFASGLTYLLVKLA